MSVIILHDWQLINKFPFFFFFPNCNSDVGKQFLTDWTQNTNIVKQLWLTDEWQINTQHSTHSAISYRKSLILRKFRIWKDLIHYGTQGCVTKTVLNFLLFFSNYFVPCACSSRHASSIKGIQIFRAMYNYSSSGREFDEKTDNHIDMMLLLI